MTRPTEVGGVQVPGYLRAAVDTIGAVQHLHEEAARDEERGRGAAPVRIRHGSRFGAPIAAHKVRLLHVALRPMQHSAHASSGSGLTAPLPDMNLLPALDALLRAGSVAGAAAELNASPSAMSRTLGRLRRVVGDPLLVPSGRGLTLTPRAREMQPRVQAALAGAVAALLTATPDRTLLPAKGVQNPCQRRGRPSSAPRCWNWWPWRHPGVRLRLLPEGEEDPGASRPPMSTCTWASCRSRCHTTCAPRRCGKTPDGGGGRGPARSSGGRHRRPPPRRRHITGDAASPAARLQRRPPGSPAPPSSADAPFGAACFFVCAPTPWRLSRRRSRGRPARWMPLAVLEIPLDLPGFLVGPGLARTAGDGIRRTGWLRGALTRVAEEVRRDIEIDPTSDAVRRLDRPIAHLHSHNHRMTTGDDCEKEGS